MARDRSADERRIAVTNKNKAEQMLAAIGIQSSEASSVLDLAKIVYHKHGDAVKGHKAPSAGFNALSG